MLLRKICLLAFSPLTKLLFALKQKTFSRGTENPLPSPCLRVLAGSRPSGEGGAVGWNPHRQRRKRALTALNSQPPFLSKEEKKNPKSKPRLCAIGCECVNAHALAGRRRNGIISEGICRNKMQQFPDSDWSWKCLKNWRGILYFILFTKIYPKSLSKNILVVKMS